MRQLTLDEEELKKFILRSMMLVYVFKDCFAELIVRL